MTGYERHGFPDGTSDERELFLRWLAFLRGAVLRKALGVSDEQARWRPGGKLLPLVGIVNHLTGVERRWIDGDAAKPEDEYDPPRLSITEAVAAYRERGARTDQVVREADLTPGLRFVLIHLINETARHAGHADAVRELLDGTTGE
ncbi:mycothiol transferase [Mangrovihabitans endophyticus]|uniref:DinB family protein n=1 Tax=Mangrovihabitans endophyticus TaxID=1751298 RepID=A0A8J3C3D4_9ACTN|nr:DUF664 domain-containing protein [Mangrovihabitans endophyticus]GGL09174.1 hypothetical protein GCM10012284_49770 [Mangrovihabitans endophyticus]